MVLLRQMVLPSAGIQYIAFAIIVVIVFAFLGDTIMNH